MAGAGYRLFNTGDVLTAAQVNTFLQEQVVMRFATTAARTTALAGVLAEGMMSYIDATDSVEVYNGSAWVSVAGSASPLTTKGDLYTYSTTNARLAVGSNGDTLVADSSASTGLRWQGNYAAGKNKIINGDFGIWQRGTSGSVTNSFTYLTDRFWSTHNGSTNGTITISRQAFTAGQTDVPNNPLYFARITNTTLGTSQTQTEFGQFIEDVNTFAGQTVTFSFYVKASGTFTLQSWAWQGFGSGGSSNVFTGLTLSSSTTSTSWQRITATVTVPSVSGKTIGAGSYLGFYVRMVSPTAGSTIDFSNWQVEAGNVATAFQTATGTLAGELAACQRYCYKTQLKESSGIIGHGYTSSTTNAIHIVKLAQTMRTNPSMTASGTFATETTAAYPSTTVALAANTAATDAVRINHTISGATANLPALFCGSNDANAYLLFTAEL